MATILSRSIPNDRLLHFTLWAAQALLACIFAAMASLKLIVPGDRLVEIMAWSASVPLWFVRGLGACELMAAVAVAQPAVTRTPVRVVGMAAAFFATLMSSAAIVHATRGELRMLGVNLAIGALAAFVAWGRLTHAPLEETSH